MFVKRKLDKIVVILVLAAIFLYASIRPTFHVRGDMPAAFADRSSLTQPADAKQQDKIAKAYWSCVVTQIQWKYGYGYHLPDTAPPEFAVAALELRMGAEADTRERYWRNLRDIWYDPNTWVTEYQWDFGWANNPARSTENWLQEHFSKLSL
jgi:hypothetical protein